MKQKWIALVLVLLMLPLAVAHAQQPGWADLLNERYYAVLGPEQRITIRSHVEPGGQGGYCQALYALELTGEETRQELDALALELLQSGASPVWGGGKHCYHGGTYATDAEYTLRASDREPGTYLYVCYAFGCSGSGHVHDLTPYLERISTMAVRVTQEGSLDLTYALLDLEGNTLASFAAGETVTMELTEGPRMLQLLSDREHPAEFITGVEAGKPEEQPVRAFVFDPQTLILDPECCGDGSITVTIENYLGERRQETVYITVPCVPVGERQVVLEPTCTEEGISARVCHGYGVNCESFFEAEPIPATGHVLTEVEEILEQPTATRPGLAVGTCQVCRISDAQLVLPAVFSDVEGGSFYGPALDFCYERGWVTGVSADAFAPGNSCMRAQVVTFLWRAAGQPEPAGGENPFEDVKESDFYYDAVLWAVENGITTGTDATHFSPFAVCNRAQVVTFLWRAFDCPKTETLDHPFRDVDAGSWYEIPVLWAVENGITAGMSADSFGPTAQCNRAQIVTFLYRAYSEG